MNQRLARVSSHPPSRGVLGRFFDDLANNGAAVSLATVQTIANVVLSKRDVSAGPETG